MNDKVQTKSQLSNEIEEKYTSLIKSTPFPLCLVDSSGKFISINDRFIKVFGYTLKDVPTLDKWWEKAYPDEHYRKWVLDTWKSAVEKSRIENIDIKSIEYEVTCKSGEVRTIIISGITLSDGFLATFSDVTDRKKVEEDLKKTKDRLLEAQTVAHLGSWEWDSVNNKITGSEEFFRLFNVASDKSKLARYEQFLELLHPEDIEHVQQEVADSLQQNRYYNTEYRVKANNGGWRFIHARGNVFTNQDSQPIRMVGTCLDITERKKTEELLIASELKFKTVAEFTFDWEYWENESKQIIYMSPSCERITGYSREEFISDRTLLEKIVHPDDLALLIDHHEKVYQYDQKNDIEELEFRIIKKDNSVVDIFHTCRPIYIKEKKYLGRRVSNRDITEKKLAEQEIRKLNEDLEKRVIERTAELQDANKELESFSYSVSHDLRAPIRAIDGFARKLSEEYNSILDDEGRRLLGVVLKNAKNMGQLIDALLAFSRLSRQNMKFSNINMEQLIAEVLNEFDQFIEKRKLEIIIKQLSPVKGDRALLRQVVVNLLSNAIKFTEPRDKAIIEIGCITEDHKNIFYIKDNGVGFNMKYVEKIFDVFQRLHSKREFEGTGVGLAIVHRIIQKHGGIIWAEAEENKGATFYFSFPY